MRTITRITWVTTAVDVNGHTIPGTTHRAATRQEAETHIPQIRHRVAEHSAEWHQQLTDALIEIKHYDGYDLTQVIRHRLP